MKDEKIPGGFRRTSSMRPKRWSMVFGRNHVFWFRMRQTWIPGRLHTFIVLFTLDQVEDQTILFLKVPDIFSSIIFIKIFICYHEITLPFYVTNIISYQFSFYLLNYFFSL